jgi:hypothetical protein
VGTAPGPVGGWEINVDPDRVVLNWVQADGNFGAFTYFNHDVANGPPRRIHVDALQAGPGIALTLTVRGFAVHPITVQGRRIGRSPGS